MVRTVINGRSILGVPARGNHEPNFKQKPLKDTYITSGLAFMTAQGQINLSLQTRFTHDVSSDVATESGNFDVKDEPRFGRPVTDKIDAILEKVEQYRHISSYDIGEELEIEHKTVLIHLKKSWIYEEARYLAST
ncbi:hypothetical protein EVAR_41588_1 [Eumeta japonica]|uniref:Histone-lysine N-methyltransferase SETMAR n=1 Tax=Eumeta variegata TaxID=151549 RepID=A0A4C1Y511_EUMVA|nr:hypothetical protein EVAR_41588_1 [Eumeta japonica]